MGIETRFVAGTVLRVEVDPSAIPSMAFAGLFTDIYDTQHRPWIWTGGAYQLNGTAATALANNGPITDASTSQAPTQAAVLAYLNLRGFADQDDLTDLGTAVNSSIAQAIATMVTPTQLTSAINGVGQSILPKADKTYVDDQLSQKASNTALGQRALVTDLNSGLLLKTDKASNDIALANKSDKGHTHDISSLLNAQSWVVSQIDQRLIDRGIIGGAPAPAPAPSPSPTPAPAPASGSGTGVTESVAPTFNVANGPAGITDNLDGTYTVDVGKGWSIGTAAEDRFTLQPRIDGSPVQGQSSTYFVDNTADSIKTASTYGAYDSDKGHWLSFAITAYNEAATGGVTIYTDSIFVTRSANTGMGVSGSGVVTGGTTTPVGGTGILSVVSITVPSNFTIPSNARSFAVLPTTLAAAIYKAGGESLVLSPLGTGVYADPGLDTTASTTWSGGTPTASGTANTAISTDFNSVGAGLRAVAAADTTTRTIFVNTGVYSGTLSVAATMSDGSASQINVPLPSEPTMANGAASLADTSAIRLVAIQFKAGSAGQTGQFDITMTEIKIGADGGGNGHIGSIYVI
jgi:hypothetical protein